VSTRFLTVKTSSVMYSCGSNPAKVILSQAREKRLS
jgi:hypothetical protein